MSKYVPVADEATENVRTKTSVTRRGRVSAFFGIAERTVRRNPRRPSICHRLTSGISLRSLGGTPLLARLASNAKRTRTPRWSHPSCHCLRRRMLEIRPVHQSGTTIIVQRYAIASTMTMAAVRQTLCSCTPAKMVS
ncbi:hypothetical protein D3C81_882720 [compost metagenome]